MPPPAPVDPVPAPGPLGIVLHVGWSYTLSVTALDQMLGTRELGWQLEAACERDEWAPRLEEAGVPVRAVRLPHRATARDAAHGAVQLARSLRRAPVALVHTHNAHHGLVGRLVARMLGVPSVHTWRYNPLDAATSRPKQVVYGGLEGVAARAGAAVLFQNHEDFEAATSSRIVPKSRARLVGNGIRLDRHTALAGTVDRAALRRDLGVAADAPLVLYVGRLDERKRQLDAIEAAARLGRDVRLVVVGTGPDEERLRSRAAHPDVAGRVVFTGERRDVPALLHAADVLCLASRREGIPRVVMEAMASRLPVVATDVVGTREVVEDGVTGVLVPFGRPDRLADALGALLGDPARREQLAEAAFTEVCARWSQDAVVRRVHDVYLEARRSVAP